jgi:hypothetical protein
VSVTIDAVFHSRTPPEIVQPIVLSVAVAMERFVSGRAWADKRHQHKNMDAITSALTVPV